MLLQYSDFSESFKSFLRQLYKPVSNRLGWEPKEGESKCLVKAFIIVVRAFHSFKAIKMVVLEYSRE